MPGFGPTARVEELKTRFLTYKPNVCIERARIYHHLYFQSEEVRDEPLIVGRALAFAKLLRERTIYIEDGQLIAGSMGSRPRAFPIYPESVGDDLLDEYRKLTTRAFDRFEFSDADLMELEEILPHWHDSSLRQILFPDMDAEEKKLFLMDPENNIVKGTNIFSLDVPLYGPAGHITPDYQTVLEIGFQGIKARAEKRLGRARQDNDKNAIDFLRAAIISCDAITDFGKRYAELARQMAKEETDADRRAELLTIAAACDQVPGLPPRTFQEAIQATWFLFVGIQQEAFQRCYSVGRLDQYAYPYLQADLQGGRISEERAQELLDCFFLKFPETNYINSEYYSHIASGFPSQQQICVGGQTPDGKDATNDLTYMCIQSSINTRLHQPSLSVRFWEGSPDALVEKTCELARLGTGHPSFFNDRRVVPGLVGKGIALEDARDYSSVGCASVQPTRKDKGSQNGGYINFAAALDFALHDGWWPLGNRQMGIKTGNPREFTSFEEVVEAFGRQLGYLIGVYSRASVKLEKIHRDRVPTPFVSCFVQDCIDRGLDRSAGGAVYNFGFSPRAVGLADVVDSLTAIRKLVFEDGILTMNGLMDALDADFKGNEHVRQMLKAKAPHYGNDDPRADDIAQKVVDIYVAETNRHRSLFGERFHPGFSSVSANIPYGTVISALPNGRQAWQSLADGCSPCHYVGKEGPTAAALSVGKLDHEGMTGGSILNIKLMPAAVAGETGLKNFVSYVKGALEAGVWHVQFNVVDSEVLREAQAHAEKYSDLLVRVAGYSAFFTGLSRPLQEDVIDRTEHCRC